MSMKEKRKMKKYLVIMLSVSGLLMIFSLVSPVLMGIGLMPGGNWHFFIVATTGVAFFLAWFALILNRKNK